MKKKTILIIVFSILGAVLLCLVSLSLYYSLMRDKMILPGYSKSEESIDAFGFQDYIDYCKYYYDKDFDDKYASTKEYKVIQEEEVSNIVGYFDNFKEVNDSTKKVKNYDFDTGIIDAGDFVYIVTKEGREIGNSTYGKYDDYTVYFYDIASHTLYYIHSNI